MQELVKPALDLSSVLDSPVSEKADGVNIHKEPSHSLLYYYNAKYLQMQRFTTLIFCVVLYYNRL